MPVRSVQEKEEPQRLPFIHDRSNLNTSSFRSDHEHADELSGVKRDAGGGSEEYIKRREGSVAKTLS